MKRNRPGKREREAGKRHRRVWCVGNMYANHAFFLQFPPETGAVPLKLGHKHFGREITKSVALVDTVADSRKSQG